MSGIYKGVRETVFGVMLELRLNYRYKPLCKREYSCTTDIAQNGPTTPRMNAIKVGRNFRTVYTNEIVRRVAFIQVKAY